MFTDLGEGESEAVGLALGQPGRRLILDDQFGRRVSRLSGLSFTGTPGAVLHAHAAGQLPNVGPAVRPLRSGGLRLGDELAQSTPANDRQSINTPVAKIRPNTSRW